MSNLTIEELEKIRDDAYAATERAACAAYAACDAAYAAAYAAAKEKMQIKIIKYGISLIKKSS